MRTSPASTPSSSSRRSVVTRLYRFHRQSPGPCAGSTRRSPACARHSLRVDGDGGASAIGASRFAHPIEGTGFVVPRVERSRCLPRPGSRRSGPAAPRRAMRCCAGSSAAAAIPIGLERSDDELIDIARDALSRGAGYRGRSAWSRGCSASAPESRSTRSGTCSAWPPSSSALSSVPGLFLAGSGFRAIGIPDCIADGRETAATRAAFLATSVTTTARRPRSSSANSCSSCSSWLKFVT